MSLGTILVVVLVVLLVLAAPGWPHRGFGLGYWPSGGLGLVLIVLIVLALLGRI